MKKRILKNYIWVLFLTAAVFYGGSAQGAYAADDSDAVFYETPFYTQGSGKNIAERGTDGKEKMQSAGQKTSTNKQMRFTSAYKTMSLSDSGAEFIADFEGLYLTAYKAVPTEKYWTIGYGHYGPDVREGDKITAKQALQMFKEDLTVYAGYVNSFAKKNNLALTQKQFDALVSFTYNCGTRWQSSSTIRTYLLNGIKNYTNGQISSAFEAWNSSGGTVLAGLTRRRRAEALVFLGGPVGTYLVTADSLNIRAEASAGGKKVGTYARGEVISAAEVSRDWNWIKSSRGWVSYSYCEFIAPTAVIDRIENGDSGVYFTWTKDPDAEKYNIMRSVGDKEAEKLGESSTESFTDKSVKTGVSYTYYVNIVNKDNTVVTGDPELTAKTITFYKRPVLKTIQNTASGIKLKWKKSGGAVKYLVCRKDDNTGFATVGEAEQNHYTDETARSGVLYRYTVIAVGGDGIRSAYDAEGMTIRRILPAASAVCVNKEKGIKLCWTDTEENRTVEISRRAYKESWVMLKELSSAKSYTDRSTKAGVKYQYRIRVINRETGTWYSSYIKSGWLVRLNRPKVSLTIAAYGVRVKWKKIAGASLYKVYRKQDKNSWKLLGSVAGQKTYKDTTAWKGYTYKYRIRAEKEGSKSPYSASILITR